MADMQNVYDLTLNREENPVYVRLPAIEQVANLERKGSVFRS